MYKIQNSGYIPTRPLEYWYHFSCKKYGEKRGVTNESDQLPDFTFLIEGGDKLVLVDTGMSWTEHADKYHHGPSLQRPGIDDIESRLAQVGYKPTDVDIVLFTHLSLIHILPRFVRKNHIELQEYEEQKFRSYNAFFTRRIREEMRPIERDESVFISPCDGKESVYPIDSECRFVIKHRCV